MGAALLHHLVSTVLPHTFLFEQQAASRPSRYLDAVVFFSPQVFAATSSNTPANMSSAAKMIRRKKNVKKGNQFDDIVAEESRIKRNPRFRDNRVHAMLYFITPTGHGLRELDIELMKRLAPRVNVIPVIGRADSLTPAELAESKKLVMEDIEHYRIPVYNFPYDIEEDDEDTVEENAELRGLMPFAIVGSEDIVEIDGRKVRARQYPWGVVEVV